MFKSFKWFSELYRRVSNWFLAFIEAPAVIYVILFSAVFHAVLRLSPDSNITLFRILLPLSILIIIKQSHKLAKVLLACFLALSVLSVIQTVFSSFLFFRDISFSYGNLIKFLIHYFSIIVLIGLLICLKKMEKQKFIPRLWFFCATIIKLSVIIDLIYLCCGQPSAQFALFGNINDFGSAMAAGLAIILCTKGRWWSKCIWSLLILILLYINDSKLALLGTLMEISLYLVICSEKLLKKRMSSKEIPEETNRYLRLVLKFRNFVVEYWRAALTCGCILALAIVLMSPITINGYAIRTMVGDALSQFFSGNFFDASDTSLLFRVNAIIGIGQAMKESFFCGVGAGNTGIILRKILPGMDTLFPGQIFVAPHIWWLELFTDFGLILIIPALILFIHQVKRFFADEFRTKYSMMQVIVLLCFPVWCMSSSGLYTEYFTLSVLITAYMGSVRRMPRKGLPKRKDREEKRNG